MPRLHLCLRIAAGALLASACSKPGTDKATADTAAATPAAMSHDSGMTGMAHGDSAMSHGDSGMTGMTHMSGMTGNADRDFLRMMSDHHKGLIALAHATVDRKDASAGVREDARKFDRKQDAELDSMTTMLERSFKDPYSPKIMAENQAMNDSTLAKKGSAFDRAFRETVIKHHQMGIKMMDEYLPKLTDAKLQAMTRRMREDQQKDISDLQRKLSQG